MFALLVCLDVAQDDVKAAMREMIAAGYDCFQTSLGGPGVTAAVTDATRSYPSS